tara:strand:- start:569 stop:697 length:129 start_codon:yes stop_codon:yes gene_type:complete
MATGGIILSSSIVDENWALIKTLLSSVHASTAIDLERKTTRD